MSMVIFSLVRDSLQSVSQVFLTLEIAEPEVFCCERCIPALCLSCCDLCDPERTKGMIALDLPPKTSRRRNRVKVDTDYTPSESDKKLKAALIEWRGQVHAEFWGGKRDHFLSPAALVSDEIIESLCHLCHARAIRTIDDIANNIRGAQCTFVMKHAKSIIDLIHSIIPLPQTASSVLDQESLLPSNIPVEPNVITAPKRAPYKCKLCKAEGHTHE